MMQRIPLNLATEPFEPKRRTVVITLLFGLILGSLFVFQIRLGLEGLRQAKEIRSRLEALQQRLAELQQARSQLEARLQRPANAEVFARSVFLNELLYRKAISWTRIFDDLEKVVPHNVRIISIRPQLDANHRVLLDMIVGAKDKTAVIDMLKRLENSALFGETFVHNWLPPTRTEPLYRYRISVRYAQEL